MATGFPRTAIFLPARPDRSCSATLERVKNSREIMEILEAYDLTGSYRAAAGEASPRSRGGESAVGGAGASRSRPTHRPGHGGAVGRSGGGRSTLGGDERGGAGGRTGAGGRGLRWGSRAGCAGEPVRDGAPVPGPAGRDLRAEGGTGRRAGAGRGAAAAGAGAAGLRGTVEKTVSVCAFVDLGDGIVGLRGAG